MDNQSPDLGPKSPEPDASIPVRVLIVEDEPGIGKMVAMMLEIDPNVSSTLCEKGEEALKLLRDANDNNTPYDLVISDQGLPGMNGIELARAIREESLSKRFTLFTGSAIEINETNTPKQLEEKGVDNVISKPPKMQQFKNEIRQTRIIKQSQSG